MGLVAIEEADSHRRLDESGEPVPKGPLDVFIEAQIQARGVILYLQVAKDAHID